MGVLPSNPVIINSGLHSYYSEGSRIASKIKLLEMWYFLYNSEYSR